MTRVVVIGAGMLGASVADELVQAGASVTVLDRGHPGAGTSGASFAWVNAQDKTPQPYFELNLEGVRTYPALHRSLGGGWFHPGGDLLIGRGPGAARAADKIERHRALGYAVRDVDRAEIAALEPDLRIPEEGELRAALFPDEAWIDAPGYVERRLARAREGGAEVRTDQAITDLRVADGRVTAVAADTEALRADVVLLAAGVASEALAGRAGVRLPMAPNPGLLATTNPVDAALWHVIHAGGVAIRPDGGGKVLLQSRDVDAGLDPATRSLEPDSEPCRDLLERAAAILPAVREAGIERARIGVRSVATDGQPVAGYAPGVDNLYLLVAHSGVTLAPVLGRLVAAELLGRPDDRLAAYRPDRFA